MVFTPHGPQTLQEEKKVPESSLRLSEVWLVSPCSVTDCDFVPCHMTSTGAMSDFLPDPKNPIYYRIVGETFHHDVAVKEAVFGRTREGSNVYPLGTSKMLSRQHMKIFWDEAKGGWKLECLGKNGLTLTLIKQKDSNGKYKTVVLSKSKSRLLDGPTPIRISNDGTIRFWFQPAKESSSKRTHAPVPAPG
ncbi:hypothetical protein AAMO2058_000214900 [Amorphochlora amoebiformis]